MELNGDQAGVYEFGEFRLNVGQLMLYRDGAEVSLRPKAVETLVALIERGGEIVSKDDLMQIIWSDAIVEESNLSRYIHMLRAVLGNQPDGKPYIETFRRRGFRFNSAARMVSRKRPTSAATRSAVDIGNVVSLTSWRRDIAEAEADDYFASARSRSDELHNLPTPLTEVIGREVEIAELRTLLENPRVRLVTLVGAGGTGKTRLSIQLAHDLIGAFADGVFFVPLASVHDPAFLVSTIARVLKIEESERSPLEDVKSFLRGRRALIVLDNFEQLLESSPLVAELLEACPRVKVLTTSRAALRIRGEHEYPLSPLSLPRNNDLSSAEALSSAAVRLFVERASQANFRFKITDQNAPSIVEICRRLEGLPLAIELAAVQTKTASPETIIERLSHRLRLLRDGARDLPARQQTMRDAIAWSCELLTEDEKSLFRRLAVFDGDFAIEAAEYIARGGDEISHPGSRAVTNGRRNNDSVFSHSDVRNHIASLTDKSLLAASHSSDPRFRMLDVVREFAIESQEASDEMAHLRERHADYYLMLGQKAEPHLQTSDAGLWLHALEADHHNLRAAIHWLFDHAPSKAAHLAAAIRVYLFVHGHLAEGYDWLKKALDRNRDLSATIRFKLRMSLGLTALARGKYKIGRDALLENLSECKLSGNKEQIADCLRGLGSLASSERDYPTARECFDQALAIYRESGYEFGIARSLLALGALASFEDDLENAQILGAAALEAMRKIGHKSGECTCLLNQGEFAFRQKDFASAEKFFREAMTIALRDGYRDRLSCCLAGFAGLATQKRDWAMAVKLTGAAEKLRESIGFFPEPQDDDFRNAYLSECRRRLDVTSFAAAYDDGRKLEIEDVIALTSETHQFQAYPISSKRIP